MGMNPNEAGQSSSRLRWLVVGVGVALVILILVLVWSVFSSPHPALRQAIPPICASIRARIANDTARRTGANAKELSALNQDMTAVTMQAKSHGCP